MPNIPVSDYAQMRSMLFFGSGSPETKERNMQLAQPLVSMGVIGYKACFAAMIQHLLANKMYESRSDYPQFILSVAFRDIQMMHDFVHADRYGATVNLVTVINNEDSEDIRALAAYLIVLTSMEFDHSWAVEDLRKAYANTVGTGCQISLALALSVCGDGEKIKSLIQQGVVGNGRADYYETMHLYVPMQLPNLTDDEIEKVIALRFTAPEIVGSDFKWSLIGMLAFDIATDGIAMSTGAVTWVRKH